MDLGDGSGDTRNLLQWSKSTADPDAILQRIMHYFDNRNKWIIIILSLRIWVVNYDVITWWYRSKPLVRATIVRISMTSLPFLVDQHKSRQTRQSLVCPQIYYTFQDPFQTKLYSPMNLNCNLFGRLANDSKCSSCNLTYELILTNLHWIENFWGGHSFSYEQLSFFICYWKQISNLLAIKDRNEGKLSMCCYWTKVKHPILDNALISYASRKYTLLVILLFSKSYVFFWHIWYLRYSYTRTTLNVFILTFHIW